MPKNDTKENMLKRLYQKGRNSLKTKTGKVAATIAGSAILCGATYLASSLGNESEPKKNNIENVKPKKQEQHIIQIHPNKKESGILRNVLLKDSFELRVITSPLGEKIRTEGYDKLKDYPYGTTAQILNKKKEIVGLCTFGTNRELLSHSKAEKKLNGHMTRTITEEYSKPQLMVEHLVVLDERNKELRGAIIDCLPVETMTTTNGKGEEISKSYVLGFQNNNRNLEDLLPDNDSIGKNLKDFLVQNRVIGNINGIAVDEVKDRYLDYLCRSNDNLAVVAGWEGSYLGQTIQQFNEQRTKTKQLIIAKELSNIKGQS